MVGMASQARPSRIPHSALRTPHFSVLLFVYFVYFVVQLSLTQRAATPF